MTQSVMPITAPSIQAGVLYHPGTNRIEFDIAHTGYEVAFCLDDAGFVTAFPEAAGAAVETVDVLHIAPPDGLHELGDSSLGFRRHQQMHMIGHQCIGMNLTVPIDGRFLQPVKVDVVILLGEETWLPIDAALHDVLRHPG